MCSYNVYVSNNKLLSGAEEELSEKKGEQGYIGQDTGPLYADQLVLAHLFRFHIKQVGFKTSGLTLELRVLVGIESRRR